MVIILQYIFDLRFILQLSFNLESFIIDCSIIESLLLLTPFDTLECFIQIQAWLLRYKSKYRNEIKLAESTKNKINYAYNFYKNILPNYIVIVI